MSKICSICSQKIVPARGNSDFLIIGDAPDEESLRKGIPFATHFQFTTNGKVLKKEFEMVGLSLNDFRLAYLWRHEPNKLEECYQGGYNALLDDAKGKKAILLVGSEVVELFTGYKVSDVSGLRIESSLLSAPLIQAMVSPGLALSRSVGEVRHAVKMWKYNLEQEGLI